VNQGQQQQIHVFDGHRFFIGQAPAMFMVETAVRALLIYVVLLLAMRLMGKRTVSQLSLTELAVMVTLGAAVGVPMQVPDRGMLPGVIVLAVALLFQRGVNALGFRSGRIARLVEGDVSILLRDGRLDLPAMKKVGVSRQQLFAAIRTQGSQQLGQIRRVYLEATGQLSMFATRNPVPGLSILPTQDQDLIRLQSKVEGTWACRMCGNTVDAREEPEEACDRCDNHRWTEAMLEVREGLGD
jgi:uncharacterized membrane protein YcaP (DUF421 family)